MLHINNSNFFLTTFSTHLLPYFVSRAIDLWYILCFCSNWNAISLSCFNVLKQLCTSSIIAGKRFSPVYTAWHSHICVNASSRDIWENNNEWVLSKSLSGSNVMCKLLSGRDTSLQPGANSFVKSQHNQWLFIKAHGWYFARRFLFVWQNFVNRSTHSFSSTQFDAWT